MNLDDDNRGSNGSKRGLKVDKFGYYQFRSRLSRFGDFLFFFVVFFSLCFLTLFFIFFVFLLYF